MAQLEHKCPDNQPMQRLSSKENRAPQYNRANCTCRCGCGCGMSSNESENGNDERIGCACVAEQLPNLENLSLDPEGTPNQPIPEVDGRGGEVQYVRTRYGVIIIAAGEFQYPPVPLPQEEVHFMTAWNSRTGAAAPNSLSHSVLTERQLSTHRSMASSSIQSRPRGNPALEGLGAHLTPSYFHRAPLVLTAGAPVRPLNRSPTQWWPLSSDQSVVDSYSSSIADEDLDD